MTSSFQINHHFSCLRNSSDQSGDSDSDSCTSTSCSESAEDSSDTCEDSGINLTYERIVSMQGKPSKSLTSYAKHGASLKRMKGAWKHPVCSCGCRVPFKILVRLCVAFWNLLKPEQDTLLWAIQHESGKHRKKAWFLQGLFVDVFFVLLRYEVFLNLVAKHFITNLFLNTLLGKGHRVCRESWAHLLGVGKSRLGRCRHSFQGRDKRSIGGCGPFSKL